ncbi:hypothetical protein ACGVWS_11795 [Enterobacteriaceae bacterium LUAb1]
MQLTTYKGFNSDLTCRGFSFEIGKSYEHQGKVKVCSSGFHSCEYPLDCFRYYYPANSRYTKNMVDGEISREDNGDSKIASTMITLKEEVTIHQMVASSIEWILSRTDKSIEQTITGDHSAASNTGDHSAASNTGDHSAASNTGNQSAASNTGYQSAASNTGNQSAAEVSGLQSVAVSLGAGGKARASENGAIVLCYRNNEGEILHIRASKSGENGIKPDVWYTLNKYGHFIEAD